MAKTFARAPLVEIIVDLQWLAPNSLINPGAQGQGQAPVLMFMGWQADEFMTRFGEAASKLGFHRSERLFPAGFPVPPGQPVFRFKKAEESQDGISQSALMQIGSGLFSANAVPPYSSWDMFSPTVKLGIEALLKTRSVEERVLPFTTVGLRYIDAFTPDFLLELSPQEFIQNVLGFKLSIPKPIVAHQRSDAGLKFHLQLSLPVSQQMTMNITVGEGQSATGSKLAMLDCQIKADQPIAPDVDKLMETLGNARSIIHDSFFKMTQDIHKIMQPE